MIKIIICVSGRHSEHVGQELVLHLFNPSEPLSRLVARGSAGGLVIVYASWSYEHLSELKHWLVSTVPFQ